MARGRLRIVSGSAGGLRLESLPGDRTRPTSERVREAVYASLGRRVVGASVLDLFAGTGAMAIEALSRGADRAVLVERDRMAAAVCRRNLEHTGFADRGRVVEGAVAPFLGRRPPAEAPFSLVCCDPPYDVPDAAVAAALGRLVVPGWLDADATVIVERPRSSGLTVPAGWEHRFTRTYGDTLVHALSPTDALPPDP